MVLAVRTHGSPRARCAYFNAGALLKGGAAGRWSEVSIAATTSGSVIAAMTRRGLHVVRKEQSVDHERDQAADHHAELCSVESPSVCPLHHGAVRDCIG